MATFQLKDGFGLNETITPGPGALSKYFQDLSDFALVGIDLAQLATQDLTNPAVTSVEGGVTFSQPIKLGTSGVDLTVGANASANLSIFVPSRDGAPLFDPDLFGDEITVGANQRYVSLALMASVTAGASTSPGGLTFGFDGKTNATLTYYEQFTTGTTVLAAVKDTISRFSIPGDLDDIDAMPEGSIATVESTGDLKFSGSANLLAVTSPLASTTLPEVGTLGVTGGAAIKVGADFEFSGDFQMRVQRLANRKFRLGFYRKKNSQFDFSASANASLTVKLGDNDLFVQLMQKISPNANADLKDLEAAGLSEDQSKAIQSAVKSAIDRTLQIGVSLEISRTVESDAMFLYEIDFNAVQPDGRKVLNAALEGDLTGLVSAGLNPPLGISVLKTLISSTKTLQHTFKVNLLGIYNVLSLSKLIIQGTQAWDASTGELVLTDSITADEIKVITSNLQITDSAKLSQILAEHFLITVTYRATQNPEKVVGSPELNGMQTFFHLEQNPSKVRMRDYLFISVALGLQTAVSALSKLGLVDDFGKTTAYAEAQYDLAACRSLFFDAGSALLDRSVYTRAGREAILNLVRKGDDDDFRLALATDDDLFRQLENIGNVQSASFSEACVNKGIPRAVVPVVGTDFLNVVFLADAMQNAGQKLQAVDRFLQSNPNSDLQNHDFLKVKQQLADSLANVVQKATVDFGGPWGFEAMASLGKFTSSKWLIINRFITSALPSA